MLSDERISSTYRGYGNSYLVAADLFGEVPICPLLGERLLLLHLEEALPHLLHRGVDEVQHRHGVRGRVLPQRLNAVLEGEDLALEHYLEHVMEVDLVHPGLGHPVH